MIILIAEDDKFLSNAYRVKLSKQGWDVKIVNDGQEAIDLLKTTKPDLILLDLIMPNVDGFEVLTQLSKDDHSKNIPIIVASNLGQEEDKNRAIKLGATDFIVKSDITLDALVDKISKLIAPEKHE